MARTRTLPKKLTVAGLANGNPRIAVRIEEYFKKEDVNGGAFNHFPPAAYLLREQVDLLPKLDATTLDRAEALFKRANELLS